MNYRITIMLCLLLAGLLACEQPTPPAKAASQLEEARAEQVQRPEYALAIHGGAGTITEEGLSAEEEKAYRDALNEALDRGEKVLKEGGSALEAVTTCITFMEDHPGFNAGKGAVFTHEGKNELDASIMRGSDRQAGAVAGVTNVKHPILAAQAVMDESSHVLLSGSGAESFAREQGLEIVDPDWFYTEERYQSLQNARKREKGTGLLSEEKPDWKYGTVGAVALDGAGNLAAGTSTGGMTNKRWNRIGDSPIIGAGTWADNETCAVSCTGHGEFFIRYAVAYDLAARLKYRGDELKKAADDIVMQELEAIGAGGGLIALDRQGNIALPFNTRGMFRGWVRPGEREVKMFANR